MSEKFGTYFGKKIKFPSRAELIVDWEKVKTIKKKTLRNYFDIWQWAFPCPKCGLPKLDFSSPMLKNPIICRNCHTEFNFTEMKN